MSEYLDFMCDKGHRIVSINPVEICSAAILENGRPDVWHKPGEPYLKCGASVIPIDEDEDEDEDE